MFPTKYLLVKTYKSISRLSLLEKPLKKPQYFLWLFDWQFAWFINCISSGDNRIYVEEEEPNLYQTIQVVLRVCKKNLLVEKEIYNKKKLLIFCKSSISLS